MAKRKFTAIADPARLSYQHVVATQTLKDDDIIASNIKEGVEILGVVGTMKVPNGTIEITSLETYNVTNYATAHVEDVNLVPSNIKKDVTILGVTGTYEA